MFRHPILLFSNIPAVFVILLVFIKVVILYKVSNADVMPKLFVANLVESYCPRK